MRKRRIVLLAVVLALVAGPLLVAHRLLTTEEGLRWALGQLARCRRPHGQQGASDALGGLTREFHNSIVA